MLGVYNFQSDIGVSPYHPSSLEEQFEDHQIVEVDVASNNDFDDFLSPNEGNPDRIEGHLKLAEPGLHVCAGTERSFFHLLCASVNTCRGLVIRDQNPKVKAYTDFNLMLFRISQTRDEYLQWSSDIFDEEQLEGRISAIKRQIDKLPLSFVIKQYYLANARMFGEIYLKADKSWRTNPYFKSVNYCLHDHLFKKIKSYAMAGNIISTVGKINDLLFLENQDISIVDTSNICNYAMIDLQGIGEFHPRVIWTKLLNPINTGSSVCEQTQYYPYIHQALDSDERERFEILKQKITEACDLEMFDSWLSIQTVFLHNKDVFASDIGSFYTKNTLKYLEEHADTCIFHIASLYPIYMHNKEKLRTFNTLSQSELFKVVTSEEIKRFAPALVTNWHAFNASVNVFFSYIDEWNTAFEKHLIHFPTDLDDFLSHLSRANLLDDFTSMYGQQRLSELKKTCRARKSANNKTRTVKGRS